VNCVRPSTDLEIEKPSAVCWMFKPIFAGTLWATVRSRHVPAERMELDLQAQAGTCGDRYAPCPDATTPSSVDLQVDWVAAYARR